MVVGCVPALADKIPDSIYDVSPVAANANEDARELFAYLCGCWGKVTLAGGTASTAPSAWSATPSVRSR